MAYDVSTMATTAWSEYLIGKPRPARPNIVPLMTRTLTMRLREHKLCALRELRKCLLLANLRLKSLLR